MLPYVTHFTKTHCIWTELIFLALNKKFIIDKDTYYEITYEQKITIIHSTDAGKKIPNFTLRITHLILFGRALKTTVVAFGTSVF